MNLHDVLKEMSKEHRIVRGKKVYCDLLNFNMVDRTIRNGKLVLVEKGEIKPQHIELSDGREFDLDDDWGLNDEEFYSGVERRYGEFYTSCATETDRFIKHNFIAKATDQLTYQEFMNGGNRNEKRYELDWFVMAHAVRGDVKWNGGWYWHSNQYPSLIVYKYYVKGEN